VELSHHTIVEGLAVGPYPRDPAQVLALQRSGISAVLNVQSDIDFRDRAIQWDLFWKFYVARGIHVVRHPIRDFDSADLYEKLPAAVDVLDHLINGGHSVYLHCTAGVNRSPTVAIAWLLAHRGFTLEAAHAHFMAIRSIAVPDLSVLRRFVAAR
jgi:hypothetical protein